MVCNFSVDHDKVPVSVPSSPASSSSFLFLHSPSLSPPPLPSPPPLSLSLSPSPSLPLQSNNKLIRATFQIGIVCQTIAKQPVERGKEAELTRDDISCKIIYATNGKGGMEGGREGGREEGRKEGRKEGMNE